MRKTVSRKGAEITTRKGPEMSGRWRRNTTIAFGVCALLVLLFSPGVMAQGVGSFDVPLVRFTVAGFDVTGNNPLSVEETHEIVKDYIGEHEGLEALQAAADDLENEIFKRGYTFHRVVLPPQKALGGVIQLKVVAFQIGNITVVGNKHFEAENIIASVPSLIPDTVPNTSELGREVEFANEHAAKKIKLNVKNSELPDRLDVELQTADAEPLQMYTNLANTGSSATGHWRASFGLTHSNLFDLDHAVTISYTTSPTQIDDVSQYGFNYKLPVYGYSTDVNLYASYSDVDSGTVADVFEVKGRGFSYGAKVQHVLPKVDNYRHKINLTFDDKHFDNTVDFSGVPLGVDVHSMPLTAGYSATYETPKLSISLSFDYSFNLKGGSDNNNTQYEASRTGARTDWDKYSSSLAGTYRFDNGWSLSSRFNAQITGDRLISGEQFSVGGASNVRGFEASEISGDTGYNASLEVYTPAVIDTMTLVGFVDYGTTHINNVQVGETDESSIMSIGTGLRWTYGEDLSLSLDYAHVLDGASDAGTKAGENRIHGNLFYKF